MKAEKEKNIYNVDWTVDPITKRSNSSEKYNAAVADTDEIIRNSGRALLNGNSEDVARCIVSNLAFRHGLSPIKETKKENAD